MTRNNPLADRSDNNGSEATSTSMGFNAYAERLNGRLAMIGFSVLLASALVAHQGF